MRFLLVIFLMLFANSLVAQYKLSGEVYDLSNNRISDVVVKLEDKNFVFKTNDNGYFEISNISEGTYQLKISKIGYITTSEMIQVVSTNSDKIHKFYLVEDVFNLDEVVVSGTMKSVTKSDSPVPVEVYNAGFFKRNPTPSLFDALQNINGVRPQINCNVCNTGDIHINGLEGPYTLVLIDGMPIVSGLSSVYGLSGIPNSLIERVEVVKGPASSLYGSEAVGGLINVITKHPENAPLFYADVMGSGWGEINTDVSISNKIGNKINMFTGVNYFNYNNPIDNNGDNFTDLTLQDRISVFQKYDFKRESGKELSLAGRYFYEDRWGGEMQWNSKYRGGEELYGESIYTSRFEIFGKYQLPTVKNLNFQFSYIDHHQNSFYGDNQYIASQKNAFGQLLWLEKYKNHDLLIGVGLRYNFYDDNTPATFIKDEVTIPSIFIQDEISLADNKRLLLGLRYDYDNRHGNIITPRAAYKWNLSEDDILRVNAGTGFRVVNLFTEEHASLSGARDVVIFENLKPEQSWNVNLNYVKKFYFNSGVQLNFDTSAWYTYFSNAILPDYDTNPNQIIYKNLDGNGISKGLSFGVDAYFTNSLRANFGLTFQEVTRKENGVTQLQMLTEKVMGTWGITYQMQNYHLKFDYTGNFYGPMRLPLAGEFDPRPEFSPTWSIQNIQVTFDKFKNFEIYAGIKNLLNWTPNKGIPFLISRANDPFDRDVVFDNQGQVLVTGNNPYGLTFDPSYVYAPNQGIRMFLGIRFNIR